MGVNLDNRDRPTERLQKPAPKAHTDRMLATQPYRHLPELAAAATAATMASTAAAGSVGRVRLASVRTIDSARCAVEFAIIQLHLL